MLKISEALEYNYTVTEKENVVTMNGDPCLKLLLSTIFIKYHKVCSYITVVSDKNFNDSG